MITMLKKLTVAVVVLAFPCLVSAKGGLHLIPSLSSINFAVMTKQIVEPIGINSLNGKIDPEGNVNVVVELSEVPIENNHVVELLTGNKKLPNINFDAKINAKALNGYLGKLKLPAKITTMGVAKNIDFPILLSSYGEHVILSSEQPVVVRASDFGLDIGRTIKFANSIGLVSLPESIPLNLTFVFKKSYLRGK
ncbi:hypothetical protein LH435_15420 [Laribacter hongkongensis]|nr:hypothetical protein [Laribacter hongkongensis]MCG9011914.1 hypothetical protein [Laribacter hongkongensis]MCG9048426.1 hypothetical protein [Laribacter hongkongensis]MCG9075358.1 hypothetical protein [Laribacter hongkongensis]